MTESAVQSEPLHHRILATVKQMWGFERLRPLQEEAIRAGLDHRDSLIVLPTGGGKSLCYQVPPLLANRLDVVISPLIALMKDQVDGLRQCGYPAQALHSGMHGDEARNAERDIARGAVRLAFVTPERIVTERFLRLLQDLKVRAFAIDEAHCISHWGHDFRPEYRQLVVLKERFPTASLHAYTATATPRVQQDIVDQLRLTKPAVLIGTFDRPNLIYRVVPRVDVYDQTLQVIRRHQGQAAIVYCISRRDTEDLASWLTDNCIRAAHYHAGMEPDDRRRTQDAFAEEKLDVIVATVAFGMGIDRSDVRCVLHAGMPKSLEHYQQETGRAGRDGLEAECVLFYSAADDQKWRMLIKKSAEAAADPEQVSLAANELLRHMKRYCNSPICRHKLLSEYFGQPYDRTLCGACDVCLEEAEIAPESTVIARKILSCVARVDQRFGVTHVVDVLLGGNTDMIRRWQHDKLSTYGLLKELDRKNLTNLVYQLIDQNLLERTADEHPILRLNAASWEVLRGRQEVKLLQPRTKAVRKTRVEAESWEGVDAGLFESLRGLRRELAEKQHVPAFIIFGDATLRELARVRPSTLDVFARVHGVGQRKLADYGTCFVEHIAAYCTQQGLTTNQSPNTAARSAPEPQVPRPRPLTAARRAAFALFADGASIEKVMTTLGRARSTTTRYLVEYIQRERPPSVAPWVDSATYHVVQHAAQRLGTTPLRPIFDALDGQVPFDTIRLVTRHLETVSTGPLQTPSPAHARQ
ncbi:MAG TPA: DNA helicase RecQ [Phycisphaerae bacterium]|nr:DNA helicase RecQ [Phycisphaerae bacterium]HNU43931.1 DNA helicase RecQ [Phycisphaerae bacterium]